MSMELMVRAMKIKVGNPLRKLVLLKLADNASDQGECWPSVPYIAEQCEISERSVQNHIQQLVKDGLVRIEKRLADNGLNRSNVYRITLSGSGANAAPYGANPAPRGESPAPGGGAAPAPRISQSFEPVNEPPPNPQEGDDADAPGKPPKIKYQDVADAYNEILGDRLPKVQELNEKRKRQIKRLLGELHEPTLDAVKAYFETFGDAAGPFYFGDNNRSWRAGFDYLLRSDVLVKTREGAL
ncbi:helix-turn-helix domain-containing protein [Serratia plymuthica]|uniref:helix-turn-helix domain-containing protein n=1 Tax=Serratia plymuthica TaxID=82996 RepID=UPI0004563252|nr:helix-turn-helix domain-containing protein [Serratia plymuthica]AHY06722.1 replication protein RepO [Serratia plymuthica]MEB6539626.1 helix-turn-helix domain-containing protein [Serratia plymuthica]